MTVRQIRRWLMVFCVMLILASMVPPPAVQAGMAPLKLSVRRLKGAELLGRVSGTFRLAVDIPEDMHAVTFYLDGQAVGQAAESPFSCQFNTRDFSTGVHRLEARGRLSDGRPVSSNVIILDFRSHRWNLAVRQSMFLYAALLLPLSALGVWGMLRLLVLRPHPATLGR